MDKGETMDTTTMFDAFDERALEEHRTKYAEEAQRKWGASDAWGESQRKTSAYTKEDLGVHEGRLEAHAAGRCRDQRRLGGSHGPRSLRPGRTGSSEALSRVHEQQLLRLLARDAVRSR